MKTKNYLKAVGPVNISLLITAFVMAWFVSPVSSTIICSEEKFLFVAGVHLLCISLLAFSAVNGLLSFLMNFDFKKKGWQPLQQEATGVYSSSFFYTIKLE